MKLTQLGLVLLFLTACSSAKKSDSWDSGAEKTQTFQEESRAERVETMRVQQPATVVPGTEKNQPF